MRVHIGPRVLYFAQFAENLRHNFVELGNDLEHVIIRQMLQGEFPLACVTRIRLAKNGMAETGHHTGLQRVENVLFNLIVRRRFTDLLDEFGDPNQNFLNGTKTAMLLSPRAKRRT